MKKKVFIIVIVFNGSSIEEYLKPQEVHKNAV